MVFGFMMVKCDVAVEHEVFRKLKGLDFVIEAYPLLGEYDFIVHVKGNDPEDLANNIIGQIRSIHGVVHTETFIESNLGGM